MTVKYDLKAYPIMVDTEMFDTGIKSAVNDSLAKIETACVTALDKFCRQMDPSAYDGK